MTTTHITEMTFKRNMNTGAYFVHDAAGKLLGAVRRVEDWTVRGTSIRWEATRKGSYLGSYATRKLAAAALSA